MVSNGKTIVSEGLELFDTEDEDPAKSNLPNVFLDVKFDDGTFSSSPCVLSSIDSRSVSLADFSLFWALQIFKGVRDKTLVSLVLRADDIVFEYDVSSDVYISTMGVLCSLSLSQPQ